MTCRIGEDTRARITAAWSDILDAIAGGARIDLTLAAAGFSRGMVRAYLATVPGADKDWDQAREASADAYFDQACAIVDTPGSDASIARVRLQALQWLASKRNPRVYGDRAQLDVNVRTVDLTRIIQDANARLIAARAGGRILENEAPLLGLPDLM